MKRTNAYSLIRSERKIPDLKLFSVKRSKRERKNRLLNIGTKIKVAYQYKHQFIDELCNTHIITFNKLFVFCDVISNFLP